ncbi:hypothetical protein, partial [Picosynechococcus sp. PCC 7002]|uniref:hypothetical protein n=1 Tax=Picosynechococcus sp. (strain ATCC 27264 / PCC 7002 / PR-6) TaxID=32049 RepID=UPI001C3C7A08
RPPLPSPPNSVQISAEPLPSTVVPPPRKTVEDDREADWSLDKPKASPSLLSSSMAIDTKVVGASTSMAFLPPPSYILKQ